MYYYRLLLQTRNQRVLTLPQIPLQSTFASKRWYQMLVTWPRAVEEHWMWEYERKRARERVQRCYTTVKAKYIFAFNKHSQHQKFQIRPLFGVGLKASCHREISWGKCSTEAYCSCLPTPSVHLLCIFSLVHLLKWPTSISPNVCPSTESTTMKTCNLRNDWATKKIKLQLAALKKHIHGMPQIHTDAPLVVGIGICMNARNIKLPVAGVGN